MPVDEKVQCADDVAYPGDCLIVDAGGRVKANGRMLIGARA
jgi:hypothetical protein